MNNYVDLDTAKKDLSEWIINFLDIPQKNLNDIAPCPFAKAALLSNKIKFVLGNDSIIQDMLMLIENWDSNIEGVVLVYHKDIDTEFFVSSVEYVNEQYYQHNGLLALEDHPEIPETIAGLHFNNQKYAIVIIQQSEKLRTST